MRSNQSAKTILITNDDGIHAEGLWAIYRRLVDDHAVTVVAPDRERSAIGHAITLHEPIRVVRMTINGGYSGFAVNGTPADCVKLGILELLEQRPDMVISGINPSPNVGVNLNYSGTVAAAKEAALFGIPAIAVSTASPNGADYSDAAGFVTDLARIVLRNGLPRGTFLNVNLPAGPVRLSAGVRISKQDNSVYADYFEKRKDPRNRIYYWQGSETAHAGDPDDVDGAALSRNYITITPIKCDMTDHDFLAEIEKWDIGK
jgi:5'-nucleotidase